MEIRAAVHGAGDVHRATVATDGRPSAPARRITDSARVDARPDAG